LLQVLKQDALAGSYLLTALHKHGKSLSREDFFQCCCYIPNWSMDWILSRLNDYLNEVLKIGIQANDFSELPDCVFTGHSLLSLLFPKSFYFFKENSVRIERGLIHSGTFGKVVLSEARGSMLHTLGNLYGAKMTVEWISKFQILFSYRTKSFGYSVGLKDLTLDDAEGLNKVIERDCQKTLLVARQAFLDNDVTSETKICVALNNMKSVGDLATNEYVKYSKETNVSRQNGIITSLKSGSKGSNVNLANMLISVGQQYFGSGRIAMNFGGELGSRSLVSYLDENTYRNYLEETKNETEGENESVFEQVLESRGRVKNSLRNGMSPTEYFYASIPGRQGMVASSISSALSGYLSRRLVHKLSGLSADYSSFLSHNNGMVINFTCLDNLDAGTLQIVRVQGKDYRTPLNVSQLSKKLTVETI
jgi:DNA-directed RNA polymerase beta' subunit